jgi:hypothetical protein
MLLWLITSAPVLILCLVLALLGRPPRTHAANTVDATGSNPYLDARNGHIGIAGQLKIGSSGAYADWKQQLFCDGEGWRRVSTASDHS